MEESNFVICLKVVYTTLTITVRINGNESLNELKNKIRESHNATTDFNQEFHIILAGTKYKENAVEYNEDDIIPYFNESGLSTNSFYLRFNNENNSAKLWRENYERNINIIISYIDIIRDVKIYFTVNLRGDESLIEFINIIKNSRSTGKDLSKEDFNIALVGTDYEFCENDIIPYINNLGDKNSFYLIFNDNRFRIINENIECPVCLIESTNCIQPYNCDQHHICRNCYNRWIQRTCPECRATIRV